MSAALQALIARHCLTIRQEVDSLSRSIAAMLQTGSADAAKTAIETAHKIVGSSGSIGFPAVGAAALALERALKAPGGVPGPQLVSQLAALEQAAHAMSPEQSSLSGLRL